MGSITSIKISVVIPTYNHAQWLPGSIESALTQTLRPHEIIVVDDGSKDNTKEVASGYPVKYVYQQNAGLSAARNTGIDVATGDWIALLDADDVWMPTSWSAKLPLQSNTHGSRHRFSPEIMPISGNAQVNPPQLCYESRFLLCAKSCTLRIAHIYSEIFQHFISDHWLERTRFSSRTQPVSH